MKKLNICDHATADMKDRVACYSRNFIGSVLPSFDRGDLDRWHAQVCERGKQLSNNTHLLPTENGYSDIVVGNKLYMDCRIFDSAIESPFPDTYVVNLQAEYESEYTAKP